MTPIELSTSSAAEQLEAVYRERYRSYVRFAGRFFRNPADAEDAVQDAFLRAWRFLDQWDGRAELSTWIGQIVRNSCLERIRRAKATTASREQPLTDCHLATENGALERIYAGERHALLIRALPALSPAPRAYVTAVLDGQDVPMGDGNRRNKLRRHHAIERLRIVLAHAA